MIYKKRVLEEKVKKYLKNFSVVGITGPRQSGKSTLLKHLFGKEYTYVTFDDYQIMDFFYEDPKRFMNTYKNKVIFDEVQKVPELFSYVKIAVDEDRKNYGKFILTGSSQFNLLKHITESLAGRIGLLSLLPFEYSEVPDKQKESSIFKGGYPELIERDYQESSAWYSAYLETYLDKDIRQMHNLGHLRDFRRFLSILAANTANILNYSNLANDLGVAVNTVKRWISILEASYIIFLLQPFYSNLGKRMIKSPKIYFYDTGLVSYLTGIRSKELFMKGPMKGALYENYIVSEMKKFTNHRKLEHSLYYYHTTQKVEIDLIIDKGVSKDLIEIKNSMTFKTPMIKHISDLKEEADNAYLVYQGKDMKIDENLFISNHKTFFEQYAKQNK